ncbi:MAG: choice-of-anchor Q domain-containing protein [Solirubrobacterales bacterium]
MRAGLEHATVRKCASAAVLAIVVLLFAAAPALAKTFVPTRHDDPIPDSCKPHDCSLREAITAANNRVGPDVVRVPRGHYKLALPDTGNDDNSDGDLDVLDEVTITGAGTHKTIIDGQHVSGVFAFLTFSPHSMSRLTVKGGLNPAGSGGAIAVGPSRLTLSRLRITGNSAQYGGGISGVASPLILKNSTLDHNTASLAGGGADLAPGAVAIPRAVIKNTTFTEDRASEGGAVVNDGTSRFGGFDDKPAKLTMENSTVEGSSASGNGGGIATVAGSTTSIGNTSVAFNISDSDASGGGNGGGIFQSAATFKVENSIVAGNFAGPTGMDDQCSGAFDGERNALTTPTGCASFRSPANAVVKNLRLGHFGSHGGPTQTLSLKRGSAALGLARDCPSKDQRGVRRKHSRCDAGAFERP